MLEQFRYRHHWVTGQTQTGKTTVLVNSALEDIDRGEGVIFIDPHGDAIETILGQFPKNRVGDLIIFDPTDIDYPVAWNPLETVDPDKVPFTASSILETLKAIWDYGNFPTPQFDQVIYNAAVAMLDKPDGTLLGSLFLLTDEQYRNETIRTVADPIVKDFWEGFNELSVKEQRELTRSSLNKLGMLLSDPRIRLCVGQKRSAFNFNAVLENQNVLLIRLPQGKLGKQKASTIGSLMLSQIYAAGVSRQTQKPCHVYVDDVQYFDSPAACEIIGDLGRYKVSLTVSSQVLNELSKRLQNNLIGNVGKKTIFRVGIRDEEELEFDTLGYNLAYDLSTLPEYTACVLAPTTAPYELEFPNTRHQKPNDIQQLVKVSRRSYASQRSRTEPKIDKFIAQRSK